ncbi:coatomer subunit alpha-1-like [Pyrus ussuriensis x Pyrus communis]|uniref:Coatomer subunit alpha-1-like n=1 Tax=Pyrus ussuriensis x Pyrus communis TaxID=2448454 RepID=A0A5N5H1R0_9ROSA|nr:coatomer subunit alpha-1-like [Pyrus ussuriensis x Pyrus communis]
MIAYLQQKGFPEVALHFVKDERTRFNLALESGNIQVAVASATTIDEKDYWYRLGVEALRQGNAVPLYLGNVKERIKILENVGHLPLAYITASVHGLHDVAERLSAELGENIPTLPHGKVPTLLMPPNPIMCGGDWPLLRVMRGAGHG